MPGTPSSAAGDCPRVEQFGFGGGVEPGLDRTHPVEGRDHARRCRPTTPQGLGRRPPESPRRVCWGRVWGCAGRARPARPRLRCGRCGRRGHRSVWSAPRAAGARSACGTASVGERASGEWRGAAGWQDEFASVYGLGDMSVLVSGNIRRGARPPTTRSTTSAGNGPADAQQRGNTQTLDALATTDFVLVGPGGAVLDKQQWLDRYRSGDLVTRSLAWDQVDVRGHGTTAVAVGRHSQRAAYQGNTHDGDFRVTLVGLQIEGQWRLIAMHLSPISLPRRPTEEQAT